MEQAKPSPSRARTRKIRIAGLANLAGTPAAEAAERLVALLSDPSRRTRMEAVRQLGERRVKKARGPLLEMIGTDDLELAARVVGALGRIGGDAVEERFAQALSDTSSPMHRTVLENLPRPFGGRLVEPLAALATGTAYPWREAALEALAHVHHPKVPAALVSLIADPDEKVALLAVQGLVKYPSPEAHRRVAELLAPGSQAAPAVKIAALDLISQQGGGAALAPLAELAHGTPEVAAAYLRAVAKARVRGLEAGLLHLIGGTSTDVTLAALEYLARAGTPACLPALERACGSPNWSVRSAALIAAGALSVPGGFELVMDGLKDPSRYVRKAALQAARGYQDDRAEGAVLGLFADDCHENRAAAVRQLALAGSRVVRDRLLDRLRDPHPDVRLAACEALENYDLGGALERVLRLTADEDPRVREAAGRLLKATGEPGTQVSMGQAYYYLESRDHEKAETILLTLQATQAGEPRVHYELGRLYARTGRTESARAHFERALELKPDHIGSLKSLSRLLLKVGDHVASQRVLERLLELMPGNLRALKGLGSVHHALGRHELAAKLLTEVLESSYDDLEAHEMLARCLIALKRYDEARAELAVVSREDPFSVRLRVLQGELEMAASCPEQAVLHYRAALKHQPGEIALLDALARAHEAAGNVAEALATARELAQREHTRARRVTVARLSLACADADTALGEAQDLLVGAADDVEVLTLKGEAHEARGEYALALDTYFRVHAIDCKTPELLLKIGRVYQSNGQEEQALRCFREYLAENPKDFETRLLLARADREAGNHADALRKIAVCMGQRPEDARPYLELARIYVARREPGKALEQARKALERATDDARVLNMAGKLELEVGDVEQAKAHLERSLALEADQPEVHRALVSAHAARGDHARVIFHHHRCPEPVADPPRFALEVGKAYAGLGHVAKAREWLERGLQGAQEHPGLLKALMEVELVAKQFERALALGQQLIAVAPADHEARRSVGLIQARRGEHKAAESHLRAVLETVPADREVREALSLGLFAAGRYEEVLELYPHEVPGLAPTPSARLLVASAQFRLARHADARRSLEALVEAHPLLVEAHQLLARVYQSEDDLTAAEGALTRALAVEPANMALYADRGRVLLKRREHERARADLLRVHRDSPHNAAVVKLLGKLELEAGNLHQSRAYLDTYAAHEARDAEGHHLRGLVLRKLGLQEDALECQENALSLSTQIGEAFLEAGELALAAGDHARARGWLEAYAARRPDSAPALRGLAEIARHEGNVTAARYYLEQLVRVDANPRETYAALLEILFASGDAQDAWKLVDRIIAEMPDVIGGLGTRFIERGQPALARELLKRAVAHGPTAELYHALALVNVALDRPAVAREALRRALEIDPSHVGASLRLGRLARQAGDSAEAKLALYRVVRLDPDNTEAIAELAALLHRESEHREAGRLIERALASTRRRPSAQTQLLAGEIFESLGDLPRAQSCYAAAIALGGGEGGAAYHRAAKLHRAAGQLDSAREAYRAFLMGRPGDLATRLELARVLSELGEHEASAREWEVVGANRGFTADVLEPLAAQYVACGKYEEAVQVNRKLLALEPHSLPGLLNAGVLCLRARQYVEAYQHFVEAARLHPNDALPSTRAAEALLAQGRHQEALQFARRACELEPNTGEHHLVLGRVYARLAMPEKAREALERALSIAGKPSPEVAVELARIYRRTRSAREALELLEAVRARGSTSPECVMEIARLHFEAKDYTRTLEALKEMGRAAAKDPAVVEMMGLAYARLGMTQKAGECAGALTQLAYVSEKLACELARLWLDAGRPAEARGVLVDALARSPGQPVITLELARVHVKTRAYAEAETLLARLVDGGPCAPEAQMLAGELYERTRNFERMREVFLRVVHQHPFQAVPHLMLARACLALGLAMEARSSFKKAVHLDSNLAPAHVGLARSMRECGELSSAVDAYKLALRLEPGNPEVLFELASVFESLDQRELAQFHLRELTRLEPRESKWAQAARERLEHGARRVV